MSSYEVYDSGIRAMPGLVCRVQQRRAARSSVWEQRHVFYPSERVRRLDIQDWIQSHRPNEHMKKLAGMDEADILAKTGPMAENAAQLAMSLEPGQ